MFTLFVDVFMLVNVFIYCFLSQEGLIINEFRVSAGLKFTSDKMSEQPQYCSDIWKFFRTFFQTFILPP